MKAPAPGGDAPQFRRFILPALFVLALFIVLWMRRPAPEPPLWRFSGSAFGTSYAVQVLPSEGFEDKEALQKAIDARIDTVNTQMSTYEADSELSVLNTSTALTETTLSEPLSVVLAEALRVHALSDGAFDVTIGPLVNAWGFGPDVVTPPTDALLQEAKAKTGSAKLTLDLEARTLKRAQAGLYIDLSAIAKGYAVDLIGESLESLGQTNYLVEIGGEVRARGRKPKGTTWTVGVETPTGGAQDIAEVLSLDNLSIATSGNYRNVRLVNGKVVTHILDPRTGEPVSHGLGSVSVLHPSCMKADALATALYVLGAEQGLALAEREGIAALFLTPPGDAAPAERQASSAFTRLEGSKGN